MSAKFDKGVFYIREAREEMVAGFLEAMIWAEVPVTDDPNGPDYDKTIEDLGYSVWDVSDEARALVTADCEKFIEVFKDENWDSLKLIEDWRQVGMDFYFTRQGHGTGFWDRPQIYGKELGDRLTSITESLFNEIYAYVQDGKVEIEGGGTRTFVNLEEESDVR